MKVIEITKKTNHKTEQIELAISILCFVNDIYLSKTEVSVLSYFVVHGLKESTEKLLIKGSIVKGIPQIRNIKSKLTKLGFLKKNPGLYKSYELALDKNFTTDDQLNILIKIDNT